MDIVKGIMTSLQRNLSPTVMHETVDPHEVNILLLSFEPRHEISNNLVSATSKGSDQPAHTHSLVRAFANRLNILLAKHNLELLCLKGGFTGVSESTLVKIPHCWKSHVTAHLVTRMNTTYFTGFQVPPTGRNLVDHHQY